MPFRNALHVSDVHMGYGAAPVLRGATLGPLAAGSVNALVGPNGAGKSTLLRGIAGLQRMRGEVRLGTALLSSQPPVQRAPGGLCAAKPARALATGGVRVRAQRGHGRRARTGGPWLAVGRHA